MHYCNVTEDKIHISLNFQMVVGLKFKRFRNWLPACSILPTAPLKALKNAYRVSADVQSYRFLQALEHSRVIVLYCLKLTNRADFVGVQNPVTQFLTSLRISITARNYTFSSVVELLQCFRLWELSGLHRGVSVIVCFRHQKLLHFKCPLKLHLQKLHQENYFALQLHSQL